MCIRDRPSSIARITSGAIQYGVPTKLFAGHFMLADPKSAVQQKTKIIWIPVLYHDKVHYFSKTWSKTMCRHYCHNNSFGKLQVKIRWFWESEYWRNNQGGHYTKDVYKRQVISESLQPPADTARACIVKNDTTVNSLSLQVSTTSASLNKKYKNKLSQFLRLFSGHSDSQV